MLFRPLSAGKLLWLLLYAFVGLLCFPIGSLLGQWFIADAAGWLPNFFLHPVLNFLVWGTLVAVFLFPVESRWIWRRLRHSEPRAPGVAPISVGLCVGVVSRFT